MKMRRKKSRPLRLKGSSANAISSNGVSHNIQLYDDPDHTCIDESDIRGDCDNHRPYFIEVNFNHYVSAHHLDIAEIILKNTVLPNGYQRTMEDDDFGSSPLLRVKLSEVGEDFFRLGHWPLLSAESVFLELIVNQCSENNVKYDAILSGNFDGPDEGVSGLVHLVYLKIFSLRPVLQTSSLSSPTTFRVRVEVLRSAFDTSMSLLEIPRQPWRKSLMNAMSWLRPEVTTSEAKYKITMPSVDFPGHFMETSNSDPERSEFDIIQFYEAIKPSRDSPQLENDLPDLLPKLRPYQRRASYWMIQRENESPGISEKQKEDEFTSPFCVPINFLDSCSKMFYNPFCGNFSLHPELVRSRVSGGILADEMGLGKTVELLACIFANRAPSPDCTIITNSQTLVVQKQQVKRVKLERVECICGAVSESYNYQGLWVQCNACDAWQHANCVGYRPKKKIKPSKSDGISFSDKNLSRKSKGCKNTKIQYDIVEMHGDYTCSLCLELAEATGHIMAGSATLIVCPAPILMQWHSEITRHTRPGSLKACIYEGARNLTPNTIGTTMKELADADIVLTTYDVLKEDLAHDSDRHDGDRRHMRFHKRYPVIPTLLTRIYWWRLCLDEAQMVESNTNAVTEMALRLRARHRWCITGTPIQRRLDDIYGLLRFLGAHPFDVYKWWSEVLRDPYERRDAIAMQFTHNFFRHIMWRSSKAHVLDELVLPPQDDHVSWLSFSAIEEHFYRKQHESCIARAQVLIDNFKEEFVRKNSMRDVDASCKAFLSHCEAAKLLSPLLKIRQACCHPQVGSSGLRSLHQSPMTMDEILDVLISKTKFEGEEALRSIVVSLNGLAALAVIGHEYDRAISLYKEALAVAKENSNDFRLDPLLNLHIHHNLTDLLPSISEPLSISELLDCFSEISQRTLELPHVMSCKFNEKKRVVGRGSGLDPPASSIASVDVGGMITLQQDQSQSAARSLINCYLQDTCETIRQKYLSVFIGKLSVAQEDLRYSHTQVSNMLKEIKSGYDGWWLQILITIEKNKELTEGFIKKIDQAISTAAGSSGSSRMPLRYQSIGGLKCFIQTGLDSLEMSRNSLLERLLEIDTTMDKPKKGDIERLRSCPNCKTGDGQLCIHCELDGLFQLYETRLFRLKKGNFMISSAMEMEEAVDLQNKRKELNLFFRQSGAFSNATPIVVNKGPRHGSTTVVVSRSPSDLEVIFGVLKSYCKSLVGRECIVANTKQLLLFEAMRKEFAHARSLSMAQAQVLHAHDEIKMSSSRMRLRISEEEPAAPNILSIGELTPLNLQFTSDKFLSLSLLARIKGQLRYLKGLMRSKPEAGLEPSSDILSIQENTILVSSPCALEPVMRSSSLDVQPCPICHDKLGDQKMMFQCGHVTCCKCFLELTEQAVARFGKGEQQWVMCPTCRQQTDISNVAYVDDRKCEGHGTILNPSKEQKLSESSIDVQGSYGTKIEAITRRILWIKSINEQEKVIVFSSWKDVLDVLEHAFRTNKISFVRMKGGRKSQIALAQFKEQMTINSEGTVQGAKTKKKHIQVLLLLMQHGANGLNILEAQHVILVEPLLNPGMEAQAISRVHRIGQEKETFVHRFMMKNTVEESIYKLNRSRSVSTMVSHMSRCQDQPSLTLQDIETLISPISPSVAPENEETMQVGNLMHLPPSMAAGIAAERRLLQSSSHRT